MGPLILSFALFAAHWSQAQGARSLPATQLIPRPRMDTNPISVNERSQTGSQLLHLGPFQNLLFRQFVFEEVRVTSLVHESQDV
jgi:hypothetical protein